MAVSNTDDPTRPGSAFDLNIASDDPDSAAASADTPFEAGFQRTPVDRDAGERLYHLGVRVES